MYKATEQRREGLGVPGGIPRKVGSREECLLRSPESAGQWVTVSIGEVRSNRVEEAGCLGLVLNTMERI